MANRPTPTRSRASAVQNPARDAWRAARSERQGARGSAWSAYVADQRLALRPTHSASQRVFARRVSSVVALYQWGRPHPQRAWPSSALPPRRSASVAEQDRWPSKAPAIWSSAVGCLLFLMRSQPSAFLVRSSAAVLLSSLDVTRKPPTHLRRGSQPFPRHPVRNRLGKMNARDRLRAVEIGERARDL